VSLVGACNHIVGVAQHSADGSSARRATLEEHVEDAADQQLQRCQPLLAVHDCPQRDSTCWKRQVVAHDCPEEMRCNLVLRLGRKNVGLRGEAARVQQPLGDCVKVLK
jgi:hypothetical protein